MIRILVIADISDCIEIESIVRKSLNVGQDTAEIHYSNTSQETWQQLSFNPYAYDFAIVELGQDNGTIQRTLSKVRQALMYNSELEVIFMTAKEYVPVDIYSVRHIHLVKKPMTPESIRDAIDVIFFRKNCTCRYEAARFEVRHGRNICFVDRDDVHYARKARYGLDLKTSEGILPFDKKIESFLDEWGNNFFRCHDSFAVNVRHVFEVRNSSIFLYSGEKIPVSRAYKKSVKNYFDRLDGRVV